MTLDFTRSLRYEIGELNPLFNFKVKSNFKTVVPQRTPSRKGKTHRMEGNAENHVTTEGLVSGYWKHWPQPSARHVIQ